MKTKNIGFAALDEVMGRIIFGIELGKIRALTTLFLFSIREKGSWKNLENTRKTVFDKGEDEKVLGLVSLK